LLPARRGEGRGYSKSFAIVPYLTPEEIGLIVDKIKKERDKLLILLLFQTGLRISEALSITPESITVFEGYPVIHIIGKGKKKRMIACPEVLAYRIRSYCYEHKIDNGEKVFDISRVQAWKMIKKAGKDAGIEKRIYPHLLRHSDAIERLRQTGNPKALQHHLGHSSITMVMRYLSTLTQEDALRIEREVRFE
jgi:integrase/recombinase XerD